MPIVRNGRQQVTQEEAPATARRARAATTTGSNGSPKARGKAAAATANRQGKAVASDAARQSQEVAGVAGEQAREVVSVVREQAAQITQELSAQGRSLYDETRQQIGTQAEEQTQNLAQTLHRLATETQALVDGHPEDSGSVGAYAQQCAEKFHEIAWEIEDRGVEGLVQDLGNFARRRPGAFLVGAALVGFGGGRLIRSAGSGGDGDTVAMASAPARSTAPARSPAPARRSPAPARRATAGTGGRATHNPPSMGGE